jgi:hypothetical protein
LKDIGVKIDDEDQALMLLLSLTKKYENLVQTLMLVGDTLTMDETRTSLLHYYKYDIWLRDFTSGICIPEVKYNWAKIPLLLRKIYEVES